jgi:IS4 transposase
MEIVAKAGAAFQRLFGPVVAEVAERTNIIQRQREFTPLSLAMTFVIGHLWKPKASLADLAKVAVQAGAEVSPQAVDQRYTPKLVEFLEQLFRESLRIVVTGSHSLAPLLERFTSVTLLDSSVVALPDSQSSRFAGCGGSYRPEQAAVKLQTELELRSGSLAHIEVEQGKSPDAATSRQHVRRGVGSLRIADLGYFNLPVFAAMIQAQEYFLSRLQFGTGVSHPDGTPVQLLEWLRSQPQGFVDCSILLGLKDRLPCRLIAWRVPEERANRRRQKLREEMNRKSKRPPSAERLAWCDWSILITNVPPEMLTPKESVVLYRARWQIELLFKRWKTCGLVSALTGSSDVHIMVVVWSRLIACVVQHWLLVATTCADPRISLHKAGTAIREFALRIITGLKASTDFIPVLTDLRRIIIKTCRRNQRKKAGTFELLNNPELLDFSLT